MRVSVVATGIDAAVKANDVPVPRRSMSQPLRERVSQEEYAPQPVAARAPAPMTPPMAAPAPMAQPSQMTAPQPAPMEEPTLFDEPQYEEEYYEEEAQPTNELPPPAYRPRPEPAMESAPETFVAPRAPAPGTPSPEALARLREAVQRGGHAQRPVAEPTPAAPRAAPAPEGDRPRFGIGSLINRMSGGHTDAPQPARQQPQVSTRATEPEADPDQERIEIPAFLRRQAN